MTFTEMTESDILNIYLLEKECFTAPWSESSLREELDNDFSNFFVAKKDDKIVGYIGSHNVLGEVYITNIAVFKAFRNKGVGSFILNSFIEKMEKQKADFITLEVRKSNKNAIKLYSKFNFKNVGTRKDFYENPKEDALLMTLYLDGVK